MPVELAEVAAGLPLAASFALAGGITTLRKGRRRGALNEAMHELRRPLQVLTLSLPSSSRSDEAVDSALRLTADALGRLDREINGVAAEEVFSPLPIRLLAHECVGRWKNQAALLERELWMEWKAGDPLVKGNRFDFAQAMDNLISNALEHGDGPVTVEVTSGDGQVVIQVMDEGGDSGGSGRSIADRRHRHGHGLRVVRRTAATHGGDFELDRSSVGTVACLRLPLWNEVGR
jgi:signal transduction histidine kinase